MITRTTHETIIATTIPVRRGAGIGVGIVGAGGNGVAGNGVAGKGVAGGVVGARHQSALCQNRTLILVYRLRYHCPSSCSARFT